MGLEKPGKSPKSLQIISGDPSNYFKVVKINETCATLQLNVAFDADVSFSVFTVRISRIVWRVSASLRFAHSLLVYSGFWRSEVVCLRVLFLVGG